jgi:preprotein translocase subunit SecA
MKRKDIIPTLMLFNWFDDYNTRELKKKKVDLNKVNSYSEKMKSYTSSDFLEKTLFFKREIEKGKISLEEIKIEAFALVREACIRTVGLYPYDVQIIGALTLHEGKIAEMSTGEGKTLVATMPAYLNALTGRGVHIITANDYLVKRDAEYVEKIFTYLGLTTGYVLNTSSLEERQRAYQQDITYITSSELGFDYLRDNTSPNLESQVLRRVLHYAIVDEIDSLLIDEANTPLVLAGSDETPTSYYKTCYQFIDTNIVDEDLQIDREEEKVFILNSGYKKIEQFILEVKIGTLASDLYSKCSNILYYINACLRAKYLYKNEKDYLKHKGIISIISSKTGRIMRGRRWGEGLHQAIEAKENVTIQKESINLASITLQNFFKLYNKLSGMTGTAKTQESEFQECYKLEVITIPTNLPLQRIEHPDILFSTEEKKFHNIVSQVKECQKKQQPVLIGCSVINTSEKISSLLSKEGIIHNVLNAKFPEKEAEIIAKAGAPSAVTIATNMAGRGTDIILGGKKSDHFSLQEQKEHEKNREIVLKAHGLFVIVAERHKSRRIDDQLKGRCARQGDPGECRFFLSLEDEFLSIFGGDRFKKLKDSFQDDEIISLPFLNSVVSYAQQQIEKRDFESRKVTFEYDNITHEQRLKIYNERQKLLELNNVEDIDNIILSFLSDYLLDLQTRKEKVDILVEELYQTLSLESYMTKEQINKLICEKKLVDPSNLIISHFKDLLSKHHNRFFEFDKMIMLSYLNQYWQDFLNSVEEVKRITNLLAYGQKDPKNEFQKRISTNFFNLLLKIRFSSLENIGKRLIQLENADKLSKNLQKNPILFGRINYEK